LKQVHPNPFNPEAVISYQLPANCETKLGIHNLKGRLIETLVNEQQNPGYYSVNFDASDLPSGIYFYRLETANPSTGSGQRFTETKKMVLLK